MTILPILILAGAALAEPAHLPSDARADDERKQVYDEEASAWADLTNALTRAWYKNKRVIVTWGSNH